MQAVLQVNCWGCINGMKHKASYLPDTGCSHGDKEREKGNQKTSSLVAKCKTGSSERAVGLVHPEACVDVVARRVFG